MCRFEKNQCYSARQVAEALVEIFPDKKFESVHGSISSYFTKTGCHPVNEQAQRRIFSGIDCQNVYDHFKTKWGVSSQLSIKSESKEISRVSIELRCIEGEELERRSRVLNVSKASIVAEALRDYYEKVPFVDYEQMSKEDLIKIIRKLQEEN